MNVPKGKTYADIPGFCKSATLDGGVEVDMCPADRPRRSPASIRIKYTRVAFVNRAMASRWLAGEYCWWSVDMRTYSATRWASGVAD